jgi:hypothetical protein
MNNKIKENNDFFELDKRKIFNLQIIANQINHYFFLQCKLIILLEHNKKLPKHSSDIEKIILLTEEDTVLFSERMFFLDYRLLLNEYKILQNIIFDNILLSFYKIFDDRLDSFSISKDYIKNKLEERLKISHTNQEKKEFLEKIYEDSNKMKEKIVKEIKFIRHQTIAHHDKNIYSDNFLNGDSRRFYYEKNKIYNLSYEKIYSLIHQILDLFIKLEQLEYLSSPETEIGIVDFINIKFCKMFIWRNIKSKSKMKIDFQSLEKEIIETTTKLEKLFNIRNLIFNKSNGNKILTKKELENYKDLHK